jgi:hypothetical protein
MPSQLRSWLPVRSRISSASSASSNSTAMPARSDQILLSNLEVDDQSSLLLVMDKESDSRCCSVWGHILLDKRTRAGPLPGSEGATVKIDRSVGLRGLQKQGTCRESHIEDIQGL